MENVIWLQNMTCVIEEFSSAEFQDRVWLKGLGPEVSSYEEAMCRLFDDLGFSRLLDNEWRQVGLGETEISRLRSFRSTLLEFDRDVPQLPKPEDVLQRSGWTDVRQSAREALSVLRSYDPAAPG